MINCDGDAEAPIDHIDKRILGAAMMRREMMRHGNGIFVAAIRIRRWVRRTNQFLAEAGTLFAYSLAHL